MNYKLLIILPLLLLISGSKSSIIRKLDPNLLSGNISINLEHGVWKLWEKKRVYQDINLDLVCQENKCESEVWGYAPKHNTADHNGNLKLNELNNNWLLNIEMNIKPDPWQTTEDEANYSIEIIPYENKLIGYYTGKLKNKKISGEVNGTIAPKWPEQINNYQPILPREHPRLIFRKKDFSQLQKKANTNYGKAIINQLEKALNNEIYYDGYVPNGGYHAAGYCFLYLLNNEPKLAEKAWQIVEKSINNRGDRILEQSPIVAGIALAYDLCYQAWGEERQQRITKWLAMEIVKLVNGSSASKGWNASSWSNWNARARGAAGLAALAILNEPEEFFPDNKFFTQSDDLWRLFKTAERNIKRYLTTAIGEHGFGTEGDLYTTEPLVLTIIPFLQAYKNVLGQDLISNSNAEWLLPHYVMRMIYDREKLSFPAYGRHRGGYGNNLFPVGLSIVPKKFLPGVLWFYDRNLGLQGDRSFGIDKYFPHLAIFALQAYPDNQEIKNPAEVWGRVLEDKQKGFYVFRNRWENNQDFIASIYAKKEYLSSSWSFPEIGSFRIWGEGGKWANAGPDDGKNESENVVFTNDSERQTGKTIFFENYQDGSGIVSILNRNWLRSFAVDYSGNAGVSGLFVIVDRFKGDDKEKKWIMYTEENVSIDDQSFLLKADNGATMKGTFITPVNISLETTEKGKKIVATGNNEFFIVMTVQKSLPPSLNIIGQGLNAQVRVGKQNISVINERIILSR